jgi:hypothetical protein
MNPEANAVEPAVVHYEITTNGLRNESAKYNGSFPDAASALRRISVTDPYISATRITLGIVRVTQIAPEEKRFELKENDFCGATHFVIKRGTVTSYPFVQNVDEPNKTFRFGTLAEARLYDDMRAAVRDLEVRASEYLNAKSTCTIVGVKVARTPQEKVEVII